MTADWRATLERVERLLIKGGADGLVPMGPLDEALVAVRGLLAEPQPDECPRCHGNGAVMDLPGDVDLCPSCDGSGLAEPQVNPSEANFVIETLRNPPGDLILAYVRSAFSPHINGPNTVQRSQAIHDLAAVADWFVVRAGLLAEGEESREP